MIREKRSGRLVCLLLAVLLMHCAAVPSLAKERGPLLLKVFGVPDPRSTHPSVISQLAVLKAFKQKYPNIELRPFTGISIQGQASESKILMAVAAKLSPDVMYVNFRQSHTYISQGFLYPLDEFVARMSEEELAERIPKPVWQVIRRKGPTGEEHVWAIPYGFVVRAMMYRKDLFNEAGLDPNRAPRDWNELKEYGRRLTNPERGTYGIGLYLNPSEGAWDWITYLWSAGGRAVTFDKEKGEWRAAFEGDAAARSMLFYVNLITEEWRAPDGKLQRGYCYQGDYAVMNRLWGDGKIAMRMSYLDQKTIGGTIDPDVIGIAPVPLGPTGVRGAEMNSTMMGIFSDIQPRGGYSVEEVRKAAWNYIHFLDGEEARRIRTQVLVEAGLGSMLNPLLLKQFGYDEYLKRVPKEWLEVFEVAMENGRPEPYGKNCQLVYNFMTRPLNKCIELGRRDKLGKTDEEKLAKIKEILHEAVAHTNEHMLGIITPRERRFRNMVAFVVAVLVLAMFAAAVCRVWKIFTPEEARLKGGWRFWHYRWAYIILLPAVLSILLWRYVPMGMGTAMVLQDYRVVGESKFVGLQNFADVLWDPTWWMSVVRTAYYTLLIFCLGFWTPIALAILLHEVSHFKIFYRTIYYLPAVLTGFVVIYLWKLLFDPSSAGVLNQLLNSVGLPSLRWLDDNRLAMLCCVLPTVWAGAGPGCLIYLAALKAVPDDLYEAADIDGCGFCGKIRYITLPTLKALIIIQFIATFIAASQSAGWILVMTGMKEATKVAGLHIFERAYMYLRFGSAVTMAWIFGVFLLSFTVQQLKILSRMEFKAAGSQV